MKEEMKVVLQKESVEENKLMRKPKQRPTDPFQLPRVRATRLNP